MRFRRSSKSRHISSNNALNQNLVQIFRVVWFSIFIDEKAKKFLYFVTFTIFFGQELSKVSCFVELENTGKYYIWAIKISYTCKILGEIRGYEIQHKMDLVIGIIVKWFTSSLFNKSFSHLIQLTWFYSEYDGLLLCRLILDND